MHLPGQTCWKCNQPISGRSEGHFCDGCGAPIHSRCEPKLPDGRPNRCPDCGADRETTRAWLEKHRAAGQRIRRIENHLEPDPLAFEALRYILFLAMLAVTPYVALMVFLIQHAPIGAVGLAIATVSLVAFVRSYRTRRQAPEDEDKPTGA